MAIGTIKIDFKEAESKLKILHKHLGNMLKEFEMVCSDCGSTDTEINTTHVDGGKIYCKVKICKVCNSSEIIETEPSP